jgi:hypothetical protein
MKPAVLPYEFVLIQKMNKITILRDKHTGIIFDPRSGSHVLRTFFAEVNDTINLGELFNTAQLMNENNIIYNDYIKSLMKGNRNFKHLGLNNKPGILDLDTCEQDDNENIETLN